MSFGHARRPCLLNHELEKENKITVLKEKNNTNMYELYEVIQLTGAANETRRVDPLCRRFGLD